MLNMNFNQRVVINTQNQDWLASPLPGVWRKPLARQEQERGHATSIVRYEAGASFSAHEHLAGEEILVLEGVFSDEHGDFPAGSYFRNPPGSKHIPASKPGCVLLVKLQQFQPGDDEWVRVDTNTAVWNTGVNGLQVMPLHHYKDEQVALVKWPGGAKFPSHQHIGGEEIYVISGELQDQHGRYPQGTWLRSPPLSEHQPFVEEDTLIWVKTGHLAFK